MKTEHKLDSKLYDLPFDQFSRQSHIKAIIEGSKKAAETYEILDVGGYKGMTTTFHPNDTVTIADIQDVKNLTNYIKLSGKKLPFKDDSFDIVVSFDTFEHIPRANRKSFIEEMYRVSRKGVLLAAPFNDDEKNVSKAEERLNTFHNLLYKTPHRWLKEHIEYGLPSASEFETFLKQKSIPSLQLSTNELKLWSQLQMLLFSIDLDTELRGRIDDVNRFYNRNLDKIDIQSDERVYYRRIYLLSKHDALYNSATQYIKQLKKNTVDLKSEVEIFTQLVETLGIKYRDVVNHRDYLEKEVAQRDNTIKSLNEIIESLQSKRIIRKVVRSATKLRKKLPSRRKNV